MTVPTTNNSTALGSSSLPQNAGGGAVAASTQKTAAVATSKQGVFGSAQDNVTQRTITEGPINKTTTEKTEGTVFGGLLPASQEKITTTTGTERGQHNVEKRGPVTTTTTTTKFSGVQTSTETQRVMGVKVEETQTFFAGKTASAQMQKKIDCSIG